MCLLVLAWNTHPDYRLVFAGNRDEFHHRPARSACWWDEPPGFLAGRDLTAGGAWLGISRRGQFGVVTNYREPNEAPPGAPSRGELIPNYVRTGSAPAAYLARIGETGERYGAFNLIFGLTHGDRAQLHYVSNRTDSISPLPSGVYGLSNHRLDTPWPKVRRALQGFRDILESDRIGREALMTLLEDRTPAPDDELPDTEWGQALERALSSPFVVSETYGTRCSTVLLVGSTGHVQFLERQFDRSGEATDEVFFEFDLEDE